MKDGFSKEKTVGAASYLSATFSLKCSDGAHTVTVTVPQLLKLAGHSATHHLSRLTQKLLLATACKGPDGCELTAGTPLLQVRGLCVPYG